MKIWIAKLGEPLIIDGVERLHRYGILSSMLTKVGHNVIYWTSTFDHFQKNQRSDSNKIIKLNENYSINMIFAPGYTNNYSIARIMHHRRMAKNLSTQLINYKPPDIILSSFPTGEITRVLIEYGKARKIPVIVDIRDLWPDIFLDFLPNYLTGILRKIVEPLFYTKKVLQNATSLIAISEQYLDWGITLGKRIKTNLDKVFYMGYPDLEIKSKELDEAELFWDKLGVKEDQYVCCFVGSINRHYNFKTLINAMKIIKQKESNIKFVICGNGSHFVHLQKLCEGMPQIVIPGWINQGQIFTLMQRSKIGICPYSKNTIISLPNKPFEYFSAGLPILSTLQGELENIIKKNNVGIVYDADDVQSFLDGFFYLYKNNSERKLMEKNANKIYKDSFSADKVYLNLIKYLENFNMV